MSTGKNQLFNQKIQVMNNYELMVIFTPVLSEEDFKSAQKKYQDLIKENGGDTVASNPWGLKSLAYPILLNLTSTQLSTTTLRETAVSLFIKQLRLN